jgi:hypothetical protein
MRPNYFNMRMTNQSIELFVNAHYKVPGGRQLHYRCIENKMFRIGILNL